MYPISDHYDGKKFFNQNPNCRPEKDLKDVLKWMLNRNQRKWPAFKKGRAQALLAGSLQSHQTVVTFINHATVLIQVAGVNFLTDPVFSDRVSPLSWAGPKRVREPGLQIAELPRVDFILLSHNHYDHLDLAALKEIEQLWSPRIICPLGNRDFFLKRKFKKVSEFDWWQKFRVGPDQSVSLTPAQHWSSRSPFDRCRSLWCGFVIESSNLKIFFSGDTGYYSHFTQVFEKYGAMDISFLPIGSYDPQWFMQDQHVNPRESVIAHLDLHSKLSIGIHFGTFQLTDEGIHEPSIDLKTALDEFKISHNQFLVPDNGESFRYQK